MAVYRQVHVSFWQDAFVLDLTPEEKYFYIYLMTNSKTSQCGIYELPKRIIETETGYNRETVDKLLKRFIEYEKILYNEETKEIMIINWVKFNFINSSKVKSCLIKELKSVKHKEFIEKYINVLKENKKDTQWIPYPYPIDTVPKDYREEEEKEEEREKEEEYNKATIKDVIYYFNNNIRFATPLEYEKFNDWAKEVECEVIIKAIEQAVIYNARNYGYINTILNSWLDKNLKTKNDIEAYLKSSNKSKEEKEKEEIAINQTQAYKPFEFD